MAVYVWDACIHIGYCFWPGQNLGPTVRVFDKFAERCDHFVSHCPDGTIHRIPNSCLAEALRRINANRNIGDYVIARIQGKPPYPALREETTDKDRADRIFDDLVSQDLSDVAPLQLRIILATAITRQLELKKIVSACSNAFDSDEEKILKRVMRKEKDAEAYAAAIALHKEDRCIFVTVDSHDFANFHPDQHGIAVFPPIQTLKPVAAAAPDLA